MSAEPGRRWAIEQVTSRRIRSLPELRDGHTISETFGSNTFDVRAMQEKLPGTAFLSLQKTIREGTRLDESIATEVAHAVKQWALERGVTHFSHWFQPQTGLTAEKHDTFLTFDKTGAPIERFSGDQLIQSEPDASSFPSGGMRTTFEARGYTAWDPSSPIFIVDGPNGKTLCIPSAFISYHGDALDKKTPLLRSMEVLSDRALRVLRLFGDTVSTRVVPTLGAEQEYFVVDRAFYVMRPDLVACGRTLLGAPPPKGQELEDHYFGSIKARILAFMQEAEVELVRLGVPVKTRHNEVAPNQFECATIFEEASVASDHNQIVMETLGRVAGRHDLVCLFHEKPFAGLNGSGKHCNWSLMDSQGHNLLDPGETPESNLQFLVFLVAVLSAVHRRAALLRAGIAKAGNDLRLGANEAPPAIISVFLGETLTRTLDAIEKGETVGPFNGRRLRLGSSRLPEIARDNTDRNRTSPFAFTGNKFEFRAVPSGASVATPVAYLNAAVAEALTCFADEIEAATKAGKALPEAVTETVRKAIVATKPVRFEGNNYSEEWVVEAERRGLPNLRTTPEALAELLEADAKGFLSRLEILSEAETEARYHVSLERYVKDVEIELEAMRSLVANHVIPAALRQRALLVSAGGGHFAKRSLAQLDGLLDQLATHNEAMIAATKQAEHTAPRARADVLAREALPAMERLRSACDQLERVVADGFWTLPKYNEMLFLS
jgi:glutamine synthetase